MTRSIFTVFFILFFTHILVAQDNTLDSIQKIDEVVITGQYSKQSVKKSVYEVQVIKKEQIQQNAASNLADILNQNLNIQIIPNVETGKSEVSLFGLDGQYFKVLVDGIPMVSDEGLGNNIDLTQINLDGIKQIEIVEGAMGVEYGANAVTGIINLITDPNSGFNTIVKASLQEETVGREYEWWKQGRHIQQLYLKHQFSPAWSNTLSVTHNDFAGFFGGQKGQNYLNDNGLRGYEWYPKEQFNGDYNLYFNTEKFKFFYKFGYLYEMVHKYDPTIITSYEQLDNETALIHKTAIDEDSRSIRYSHNVNINGLLGKAKYDLSLAYQKQNRDSRTYQYDLYTRESTTQPYEPYLNRNTFYAKNTFTDFYKTEKINFQLGSEFTYDKGYIAAISTDFSQANAEEQFHNIDFFASSEIKPLNNLFLRPGIRYSFQSIFDDQLSYSLSSKLNVNKSLSIKNVIGTSYRTPNFEELYTLYDTNSHTILGNENLKVENGTSIFTHLDWTPELKNTTFDYQTKVSVGFINLKNKISLALLSLTPLEYTYINIDKFKSRVFTLDQGLKYKNTDISLGISVIGEKEKAEENPNIPYEYLYKFQLNSGITYRLEKYKTYFSLNYKYNGKDSQYVLDDDDDARGYSKIELAPYHWADLTVKKIFWDNKLETTLGIRNLFDVKELDKTGYYSSGGTHSDDYSNVKMGYGRSYFMKLTYTLQIK